MALYLHKTIVMAAGFVINPFWTGTNIPEEYFCDRDSETRKIIRLLRNRNNVVLKAERRVGKTSLLHHLLRQPEILDNFNTYFVDIWATRSFSDFTARFAEEIGGRQKTRSGAEKLLEALKSVKFNVSYNPVTEVPSLSVFHDAYAVPESKTTIREIFSYLERTAKPNIVVFDEFQQIRKYEDGDASAVLRSAIQGANNSVFVYSGSEQHMLELMFNSENEPFFRSSSEVKLEKIPCPVYSDFAQRMFRLGGKEIEADAIESLYSLTRGYTSYLNKFLNEAYSLSSARCTRDTLASAIESVLQGFDFQEKTAAFTSADLKLLGALASEGSVAHPMASDFVARNNLGSASRVQTSMKKLLRSGHIIQDASKAYMVGDLYLELWLKMNGSI